MTPYKIAIAAYGKYATRGTYWDDDAWLRLELEQRGHHVDIIDWHDEQVMLTDYQGIFVSSTWDIPSNPSAFERWLDLCEADGVKRLINASHLLRHGIRKYDYLSDLIAWFGETLSTSGSVVPTRFYVKQPLDIAVRNLEAVGSRNLRDILAELDQSPLWRGKSIVIKPVTSASGKNTFLYDRSQDGRVLTYYPHDVMREHEAAAAIFDRILDDPTSNGVILQTFIANEGEYSLTFFERTFSHAVRKPAGFKADRSLDRKFVERDQLPSGMVDFARQILYELEQRYGSSSLTRTRIDLFVEMSTEGHSYPVVSEVEFVEPNTNIRIVNRDKGESAREKVVARFADAIEKRVKELVTQTS
jgi:hypothetical protein